MTLWVPGATPQYYPLVFTGFWIEHALAGDHPLLYHAVNIAMHAGSTLLLWRILRMLEVPAAAWIAALFAVHPMGVETVAWATERKNTQSLLFALASIMMFLRADEEAGGRRTGFHLAAFGLFIAALLSKTTAVFVAPVLVMIALHRRLKFDTRRFASFAPYFVAGAAMGLFTAFVEKVHVGASGADFELSAIDRVLLAARNCVFYITHFVLPSEQSFVYPRIEISAHDPIAWIPLALMLVLLAGCVREWRRGVRGPLLVLMWMCAALFPALGFIDVWPFRFSFVADHFAYAAMPALAAGTVLLARMVVGAPAARRVLASLALSACVVLSWIATTKYANAETLWRDTITRNPTAWLAHNNLAKELLGRIESVLDSPDGTANTSAIETLALEAYAHARIAEELKPTEVTHPANQAEALRILGRRDEAIEAIDRAVRIAPHLASIHLHRATMLDEFGNEGRAAESYRDALARATDEPTRFEALYALRRLAINRGDLEDALVHARGVVEITPGSGDALADLGSILLARGEVEAGRVALHRALTQSDGFSSERAFVATAVRYLKTAVASPLPADERDDARAIAEQLARMLPREIPVRYFLLALDFDAQAPGAADALTALAAEARRAGAEEWAATIESFLAGRSSR